MGFPDGSSDKEPPCDAGDPGLIPGLGKCPGERNGYPLQHSYPENSVDRGACPGQGRAGLQSMGSQRVPEGLTLPTLLENVLRAHKYPVGPTF